VSEERKLPPDVAAAYQRKLAELRLTAPHWGGGTQPDAVQRTAREQELDANIGSVVARVMANVPQSLVAAASVPVCELCGVAATPSASGKRLEIVHDLAKHPFGEIPASQLEIKPMRRSKSNEDVDDIFGGDRSRETYNDRLAAGQGRKRLGSGE
jgi:hypothetical protein